MTEGSAPKNIDEYVAAHSPNVQAILEKIRRTIREVAPQAQEKISYRMPAFFLRGALIYFAAFKTHIGLYPPVKRDAKLLKDLARYRGPKGNLKFSLHEPIPYALIKRVIKSRLREHLEQAAYKRAEKK